MEYGKRVRSSVDQGWLWCSRYKWIFPHYRYLVYSMSCCEIPTFRRHLTRQRPRPFIQARPGPAPFVCSPSVVRCSVWSSIELSHVNHLLTEARPSSLFSLPFCISPPAPVKVFMLAHMSKIQYNNSFLAACASGHPIGVRQLADHAPTQRKLARLATPRRSAKRRIHLPSLPSFHHRRGRRRRLFTLQSAHALR